MGLIASATGVQDYNAVRSIASEVARLWNENGGDSYGFTIEVGKNNIQRCCDHGAELLRRFCPNGKEPGPFKRVATLVVLSRLEPFFQLNPQKTGIEKNQWLSRISALLIPPSLKGLRVDVSNGGKIKVWERLDHWRGFPSPHYKADFLAWLSWMDTLCWLDAEFHEPEQKKKWHKIKQDRIARMILVTALILEACYYCGEKDAGVPPRSQICGKCRSYLAEPDLTPVNYDLSLYNAYIKKMKGKRGGK